MRILDGGFPTFTQTYPRYSTTPRTLNDTHRSPQRAAFLARIPPWTRSAKRIHAAIRVDVETTHLRPALEHLLPPTPLSPLAFALDGELGLLRGQLAANDLLDQRPQKLTGLVARQAGGCFRSLEHLPH